MLTNLLLVHDTAGNKIAGTIPTQIGKLSSLRHLGLGKFIPSEELESQEREPTFHMASLSSLTSHRIVFLLSFSQ